MIPRPESAPAVPTVAASEEANRGVLRRAAALLRALEDQPAGLSLAGIAQHSGLPRSTVHRLVRVLCEEQLVAQVSPRGGYRLGPALVRIAASMNGSIAALVRPEMARLSQVLNETVDLAFLVGHDMTFVDQVAVPHRLQAQSMVGGYLPMHCTASGKALLSAFDDAQVLELVDPDLKRYTANTIVDRTALLAGLALARGRHGVAFDREEHHVGVCGAAVPVVGPFGTLAALGVPLPSQRFHGREGELSRALLQARDRLQTMLQAHL